MAPHSRTVDNALWAVENTLKINPGKSKTMSFTGGRVKSSLNYFLEDQRIPEASSCKYLGLIINRDLSWADQINYTVLKVWNALQFKMSILQKGNSNTKIYPTRH
jgi:hypothetical protein